MNTYTTIRLSAEERAWLQNVVESHNKFWCKAKAKDIASRVYRKIEQAYGLLFSHSDPELVHMSLVDLGAEYQDAKRRMQAANKEINLRLDRDLQDDTLLIEMLLDRGYVISNVVNVLNYNSDNFYGFEYRGNQLVVVKNDEVVYYFKEVEELKEKEEVQS